MKAITIGNAVVACLCAGTVVYCVMNNRYGLAAINSGLVAMNLFMIAMRVR